MRRENSRSDRSTLLNHTETHTINTITVGAVSFHEAGGPKLANLSIPVGFTPFGPSAVRTSAAVGAWQLGRFTQYPAQSLDSAASVAMARIVRLGLGTKARVETDNT